MRVVLPFILGLMLVSVQAHAIDASGNYAVWGAGKKSCFGFQQDMSEGNTDKYANYMKGFITAYNIFTDNTYSISGNMNENQIFEWIDGYCTDNPMSSFEAALTSFTFDHYDNRSKNARANGGTAW